jgi:hypothetical protein
LIYDTIHTDTTTNHNIQKIKVEELNAWVPVELQSHPFFEYINPDGWVVRRNKKNVHVFTNPKRGGKRKNSKRKNSKRNKSMRK